MLYFENFQNTNPFTNLAVEEYILRQVVSDEPILHFYINEPVVIIGRNQNVFEEVDVNYARNHGIPVLRRLSGGGTVYHDFGNINYSLILPNQDLLNDYTSFTRPVINALKKMGLRAALQNRSSIFVNGKKVSGNAQYATGGKMVSHGTLLLHTDLAQLRSVIQPQHQQIKSRAVQSVRSRVANLHDFLDEKISLNRLKDQVKREFLGGMRQVDVELNQGDWKRIKKIAEERYHSWEWNIGSSPRFSTTRRTKTSHGEVVLEIEVDKGFIQEIRSKGRSFKNTQAVNRLSECLAGIRYEQEDIALALLSYTFLQQSFNLSEEQLVSLVY